MPAKIGGNKKQGLGKGVKNRIIEWDQQNPLSLLLGIILVIDECFLDVVWWTWWKNT